MQSATISSVSNSLKILRLYLILRFPLVYSQTWFFFPVALTLSTLVSVFWCMPVHSSKFAISESHEYEFALFHFYTSEMNWHRVTGLLLECGCGNDVICFVFLLLVYPILSLKILRLYLILRFPLVYSQTWFFFPVALTLSTLVSVFWCMPS
jgi:hypothetical protein